MDWVREIDELHEYFEAYFLGTTSSLDRLEAALAPGFTMTSPDGSVSGRAESVRMVADGHAHTSSLRIETTDHHLVVETGQVTVASYIETHHLAERRNDRRTTVVFERSAEAPNGLRWLHAQETWIS